MAQGALKITYTTTSKLPGLTLTPGMMVFCEDDRSIRFVNSESRLINYQSVVSLESEAARQTLVDPYPALYWIKETASLWRYEEEDGWVPAAASADEQIIFGERPAVGEENKLYIDGLGMYLYMNGLYIQINGGGGTELNWLPIE